MTSPNVTCSFDDAEDWDLKEENLEKLIKKYKGKEYPLLTEEIPHDWETNPDYQALHQILYTEGTPEERAESFRQQGNEHFADAQKNRKKEKYVDAIKCYSEGIRQDCKDQNLSSLLFSNRAHVRLILGDFIDCVDDCRHAIRANPSNIKAYFRAAKASYYMQLWRQCLKLCEQGLKIEVDNEALKNLQKQAEEKFTEYKKNRELREQQDQKSTNDSKKQQKLQLIKAYHKRGLTVHDSSDYDTSALQVSERHYWDPEADILHWPCLCLYPAAQVSEMILDFPDDSTLSDQLKVMFPENRSAEWDTDRSHIWHCLSVYYEAGFPDGSLVRVPTDVPLRAILTRIGTVSKVPVLHIMVADSGVEELFRVENRIRSY